MSKDADKKVTSTMLLFMGALLVLMVILILVANSLMRKAEDQSARDTSAERAAAERIRPVGEVYVGKAGPVKAARSGKEVVQASCAGCHGTGALGAPKIGNAADWAPRIKQGLKTMLKNALNGKGNMPPQKGAYSEQELIAAIKYMSGIK